MNSTEPDEATTAGPYQVVALKYRPQTFMIWWVKTTSLRRLPMRLRKTGLDMRTCSPGLAESAKLLRREFLPSA